MRHQHAGLAIPDFPAAYGKIWPDTNPDAIARYNAERMEATNVNPITAFQIILQMIHRIVALVIFAGVAAAVGLSVKRLGKKDPLTKLAFFWLALILLQIALGIADDLDEQGRRCRDGARDGRRAFARDRRALVHYCFWPFGGLARNAK